MKSLYLCLFFAVSGAAAAAGGGGDGHSGLPIKTLLIQLMNFTPFALLLFFLLKKPVSLFFAARKRDFFKMEKQAQEEERQAQAEHKRLKARLAEQTEREKTAKALALKAAERFKQKKALEIQETEASFEREKQFFVRLEEEKAYANLLQTLTQAISKEAEGRLKVSALKDKIFHQKIRQDFLSRLPLKKL